MKLLQKIKDTLSYAFTWLTRDEKKEEPEQETKPETTDGESSFQGSKKFELKDLFVGVDKDALKTVVDGLDKEKIKSAIDLIAENGWISSTTAPAFKIFIDTADKEDLKRKIDELDSDKQETSPAETPASEPENSTPANTAEPEQNSPKLNWCWGGFNGSKSTETDKAQIKNLKVSGSGLSYEWATGGCENLGATSATDADHTLACLFLDDGRGGKFDWISTSRKTRDFKNIEGKYNGWDPEAFKKSKTLYFCICSRNGLVRTNIISASK